VEQLAHALVAAPVGAPANRAEDHLQGDRPHPLLERERLAQRPGRDLASRELGDEPAEAADRAAVEGRLDQIAMALVGLAVEQEQRAIA
jgi:hypothetical protein